MSRNKKGALFVCLGNICRSPIAEAVFIDTVAKAHQQDQWDIDSAGIGSWHAGNEPDHRACKVMRDNNLAYKNRARQIKKADFDKYDYIFGMDDDNISDLKGLCPKGAKAKILLLGDYDPEGDRIIRDPYYDRNNDGFSKCYDQSVRCCKSFLEKVQIAQINVNASTLKILFICIGNSCRSPMAESVLKHLIRKAENPKLDWMIDSAALASWNVGLTPEPRCIAVLGENGMTSEHITRQITAEDFLRFDYIFGMDLYNIRQLREVWEPPNSIANVELLAKYDYGNSDVIRDPYFDDGIEGFRAAYVQIYRSCENFIAKQMEMLN